ADIFAPTSSFQFAPGSTIGAFLVSQDLDPADGGTEGIFGGVPREGFFSTGVGSDVRFVDLPRIDLQGGINSGVTLRAGVPVELIDDGGATVRVSVTGGATGVPVGFLRFIPIDGSEGVALGQIDNLDLTGRSLLVETLGTATDGRVSIGRINLVGADAATNITFSGNVELDVWQIVQTGGDAFNALLNETPRGDFVAIDVVGLNTIDLTTGNLGRTEVVEWGPRLLGPNLGLGGGPGGMVGGTIGVPAGAIDGDWSGAIFRPANDVNTAGGTAYLDDIGGPFDGFLNGLVVRTGNVAQVRVGGVVGDVILQGGDGTLTELVVNTDNFTPIGEFHGIVGSVYAANIVRVEVGDGLRGDQYAPLSSGTIMAANQIIEVTGGTFAGRTANISGRIWAANLANTVNPVGTPAVGRTFLQNGNYVDATIGAGLLDGFWISVSYDDARTFTGTVDRVTGTNANFFRSEVLGQNINEFNLVSGFFDASRFNAQNNAGTITATGYRNSTLSGTDFEFRPSIILIGSDLGSIRTQTPTGDIRDTVVDVVGSITQGVSAGFITRSEFQVDNEIPSLAITGSIRGSKLVFGRLEAGVVGGSIRHSEFTGNQILSLAAGDSITNTIVRISGPNGRLDLVSAANSILDSEFIASGPIGTITTTTGDLDARIRTTTGRGTVGTLSAGRDLVLDTDISRGLSALIAGRHIGRQAEPTVVLVRGNLTTLTAPNGQLYSDVRVGQTIGGTVTLGAASSLPASDQTGQGSIIAFGSITNVVINGNFGGSIISYTGGIGSVAINNGSFLRGDAARPNTIAAYDGDITSLVITNGNLYGDVYADYDLVSLRVVAGADGVFGDIGVNPAFNANQAYDNLRNRVPVGVAAAAAIQGPRIGAGRNIISVAVTGGSVFEAGFHAGRAVQSITIAEGFTRDNATSGFASYVVAGDLVDSVVVGGDGASLQIIAGVLDLGADQRPG
ncbi:MAG: hypothetical protein KDA05_11360, partial [Phycisphaerales bacterium]|nr:hypothetical protein [Phycisphaerales bacterium]